MMNYNTAKKYADELKKRLSPYCKKIEIAGSIRRGKQTGIKDIELVVIPETHEVIDNLFGNKTVRIPGFINWVNQWERIKGDPAEGKYCQRQIIDGVILDLFIADESNFGWIYLLRTGPLDFTKNIILPSLRSRGIKAQDGRLYDKEMEVIDTPTEESVFDLLGTCTIQPKMRDIATKITPYQPL